MTNAILLERACSTGLPFGIEEGKGASGRSKTNQIDITDLIMDLANGSSSANMKMGTMKPQTVPLIASNFAIDEMARYRFHKLRNNYCTVHAHCGTSGFHTGFFSVGKYATANDTYMYMLHVCILHAHCNNI